jgi:hypothetical protein
VIPDTEFNNFVVALMDAEQAAERARPMDGYEVLLAGLRRAELGKETGELWAEELLRYWRLAADGFCRRHQIDPLPPVPPMPPYPRSRGG